MGGRNSVIRDPFDSHRGTEKRGNSGAVEASNQAYIRSIDEMFSKGAASGEVSKETANELKMSLRRPGGLISQDVEALISLFNAEKEGTSASGRSRLATQKLYDTVIDQPGRRQTLLTPRSNNSSLGV